MSELASRAHMRQQPTVQPVVERIQVEQPTVANVIGVQDIVWDSYYDLKDHFVQQFQTGSLPTVSEPDSDPSNTTAIIAGKEVNRQPYIDDFADMMRREDCDNHTRLERYINPIGPAGGLDWFKAAMLAAMIESGRIGVKEDVFGNRAVYAYRARTGNPFFRIFGGRVSVLIAVAQWILAIGVIFAIDDIRKVLFGETAQNPAVGFAIILSVVVVLFVYNLVHWRFHKRYAFILNSTLVDGWKARNAPSANDNKWACGRMAAHAINLAICTTAVSGFSLYLAKSLGWL